ncbi:MAG: class I SAM-dependent methyltransferase [Pseudomonadota bacterium]
MLKKHKLDFKTYAEIGCGAGGILHELARIYPQVIFHGYDISPQSIDIAKQYESSNVKFFQKDILLERGIKYDMVAVLDVLEHVDDYMAFLKRIHHIGDTFLFIIPLEITVSSVLRNVMKDARQSVGHLHYFMKDTALATLADTGYDIIDWFYTTPGLDYVRSFRHAMAWLPRRVIFAVNPDLCVRALGGFPLLALCRTAR